MKTFWIIICLFAFYGLCRGQDEKGLMVGVLNNKAKTLPMPKSPPSQPRIGGNVIILVKINLQKGEVIWAKAISGHSLLRFPAENAAKTAKFEPILTEFDALYATGVLVYKIEDFNGKTIENKRPRPALPLIDSRNAIINGKAIKLEKPEYHKEAKDVCANGKVEILTLIHSGRGEVIAAKAISGNELLFEESEKAIMKSKFSPSNINGDNGFYVLGKVVYNFDSLSKCINVGIVNKKATSLPKPQVTKQGYFRINEEQIVAVQIVINMEGKVTNANAIYGHALLRSICENAARQAKFPPILSTIPPIKINALLVYKFKPGRTIDTEIEKDDKSVLGKAINLVIPPFPSCNCKFEKNPKVLVEVEVNEQGNVIKAKAISGHPLLRVTSEHATRFAKFLPISIKTKVVVSYNFSTETEKPTSAEIKNVRILK